MKRHFVWLLAFSFSWNVLAGDSAGNGGDLVTCREAGGNLNRTLLDYFEGKMADPNYELSFPKNRTTPEDKVAFVLDRLATYDYPRANAYHKRLALFDKETLPVTEPLEDADDTGVVMVPEHCFVAQWALQRRPAFPSEQRYLIDLRLWDIMDSDPDQQAGLMLHEIIYREALALGQVNSLRTRKFNRVISSRTFTSLSQAQYNELAAETFITIPKIDFLQGEFVYSAAVGTEFKLELRTLLKSAPTGEIQWFTDALCPSWLKIESGVLKGTPPSAGHFTFQLIARQGEANAITWLSLRIP